MTIGIPWVNTIAADRYGDALYSDISVVPNVSISQYNSCIRGPLQNLITAAAGLVAMDGSDSACEWGNDAGTAPGIFGYDNLPKLETRDYGANANDSYWLANPRPAAGRVLSAHWQGAGDPEHSHPPHLRPGRVAHSRHR